MPKAKSRTTLAFHVDFKDINREMNKYIKTLGVVVKQTMDTQDVEGKLVQNVCTRLSERYPFATHVPVGRIALLKKQIGKNNKTSNVKGSFSAYNTVTRTVKVEIGHIDSLDKATQISKLDAGKTAMKHYMPSEGHPRKNNTGAAASRFHLWRLLEFPRRSSYTIAPTTKTVLKFTTGVSKSNPGGYDVWQYKARVHWKAKISPATRAYYFLSASRTIYEEDKKIIRKAVIDGVNTTIQKYTRFHK